MNKIALVGSGWLGSALAESWQTQGRPFWVSARSPDKLNLWQQRGIKACQLNLDGGEIAPECFSGVDTIVVTVPPGRGPEAGDYCQKLEPLATSAKAAGVTRVLFTSASSVYGSGKGRMTESSQVDDGPRAMRLLQVEQMFARYFGDGFCCLRLSGLVGGERHPGRFMAGKLGVSGGRDPVNLVHQRDVVSAINALLDAQPECWNDVYNLCAPHHPTRQHYYQYTAERLALVKPEFVDAFDNPRWVDGSKITRVLPWQYHYSDLYQLPELIR